MLFIMKDRKEQIREIAADLIQKKGYNGFSYQDLADQLVGMKKRVLLTLIFILTS